MRRRISKLAKTLILGAPLFFASANSLYSGENFEKNRERIEQRESNPRYKRFVRSIENLPVGKEVEGSYLGNKPIYYIKKEIPSTDGRYVIHVRQEHFPPNLVEIVDRIELRESEIRLLERTYKDLADKQRHELNEKKRYLLEFFRRISSVQEQIYFFLHSAGTRDVYIEGLKRGERLDNKKDIERTIGLVYKSILSLIPGDVDKNKEITNYYYCPGADLIGAYRGSINAEGVEPWKMDKKIDELFLDAKLGNTKRICDYREKEAIKYMLGDNGRKKTMEDDERIKILVYGAAHDFSDEIREWNMKHHNEQWGYVIVTPRLLRELERRHLLMNSLN